ncbi:MAG: UDP-N-acetylmuramoyl-tripeptide--D-alanyl-D-alanine ligase [Candidatus Brocadiia bacterium]
MERGLIEIAGMARTRLGRRRIGMSLCQATYPLLRGLASVHRRLSARRARFVAVVGSFGKTTTARAVNAALGRPEDPEVEHNSFYNVPWNVLRTRLDPGPHVIEVGICDWGQMEEYAGIVRPDAVVVTAVGSEHGTTFGTLEATRSEKVKMVEAVRPGGHVVLNGDDPNVRWMASRAAAPVTTFGLQPDNDVRADDVRLDWPHGTAFTLHANGGSHRARIRLLGQPGLYAALAGVALARAEGVSVVRSLGRLRSFEPTRRRLNPIRLPSGAWVIDDTFKGGEETQYVALALLGHIPARRRTAVLGEVTEPQGSRGDLYRGIGEEAGRVADLIVSLARSKVHRLIRVGAERSGMERSRVVRARNPREAVEALPADLGPGDVVLLKGRGTQHLERVAIALQGRTVRCQIRPCKVKRGGCWTCPMLERGWDGLPRPD